MGTRGLVGVQIDGQRKLTYNHNDSYPSGLGLDILHQLDSLATFGWNVVKDAARAVRLVQEDSPATVADVATLAPEFADFRVGSGRPDDWYCLLRKLQGDLMGYLGVGIMIDNSSFLNDDILCEWSYIVNLDTMKFEVFEYGSRVAEFPLEELPIDENFLHAVQPTV